MTAQPTDALFVVTGLLSLGVAIQLLRRHRARRRALAADRGGLLVPKMHADIAHYRHGRTAFYAAILTGPLSVMCGIIKFTTTTPTPAWAFGTWAAGVTIEALTIIGLQLFADL